MSRINVLLNKFRIPDSGYFFADAKKGIHFGVLAFFILNNKIPVK